MAKSLPPAKIEQSLEGLAGFFRERQSRPGLVARRLLGVVRADDDLLVDQLIAERRRRTRMDGGVSGWVIGTTWSALEIMQLGCPPDHTGVSRMVGYLLARQDLPGRFGEGVTDGQYEFGRSSMPMRGFFSPCAIDQPIAPTTFPSGALVHVEWEARFAASCFALRAALQARQERRESVRWHLECLLHLAEGWIVGRYTLPPTLLFFMAGALAMAPLGYRERLAAFVTTLAGRQEPDGTWADTSLFHALDAMLLIPMPDASSAVRRAVPPLIERQRPSGAFDETDDEELALIAARALCSQGSRRSRGRPTRISAPTLSLRGR